jgi:hypothetical protein
MVGWFVVRNSPVRDRSIDEILEAEGGPRLTKDVFVAAMKAEVLSGVISSVLKYWQGEVNDNCCKRETLKSCS